jgi:hypothetical protein
MLGRLHQPGRWILTEAVQDARPGNLALDELSRNDPEYSHHGPILGGSREPMRITDPYLAIQEWWGEPLCSELARRIAKSPHKHIEEFTRFAAELPGTEVPKLEAGLTRPLLKRISSKIHGVPLISYINTAISLLLYSEEAIVEDPIQNLDYSPDVARGILSSLLQAQPLTDAGLIKWMTYPPHLYHPSNTHSFFTQLDEVLAELPDGLEIARAMNRLAEREHNYDLSAQISLRVARWGLP